MSLAKLAALHADDALNAAWLAFTSEIPMSWLPMNPFVPVIKGHVL